MRKIILLLVLLLSISVLPNSSEAKTVWDGAEVVKGQTGKMTFTKDVKVYKKSSNGEFESLVVKKGQYFRVYAIEKYDGQIYYWMSSGYRVQATNLVIFKEVPLDIRKTFYENPVTVFTSRNKAKTLYTNTYSAGKFNEPYESFWPFGMIISMEGDSKYCFCGQDGEEETWIFEPTDITIVDSKRIPANMYEAKRDTYIYNNPLGVNTKETIRVNKGYIVNYSPFNTLEINGYIQIYTYHFIKPSDFEVVTSKGVRYIQNEAEVYSDFEADSSIPRDPSISKLEPNAKVELFTTFEDKSLVLYNNVFYLVDSNALGHDPIEF